MVRGLDSAIVVIDMTEEERRQQPPPPPAQAKTGAASPGGCPNKDERLMGECEERDDNQSEEGEPSGEALTTEDPHDTGQSAPEEL